jgi:pimeloyl-ACP methyl ester carboxylesterase/DNA-binding CsgD family transcriptional regulator
MTSPVTKYARSGDVRIAYQTVGTGPFDLVFIPGFVSNVEVQWEDPGFHHLLTRFSAFSRLITFDKRGTGLSDHVNPDDLPDLQTRMDDVRAVMDAVGSKKAAIFGGCEGGAMAMLFAATYPERTRALVLYGAYARFDEEHLPPLASYLERVEKLWGSSKGVAEYAPSAAGDPKFCEWFGRFERLGASPAAARELFRMNASIDVREILPSIRVPTLVLHRRDDIRIKVGSSRYLTARIPGATYVELDGRDHLPFVGNVDQIVDESEEFLTGARPGPEADRVLATIFVAQLPESAGLKNGALTKVRNSAAKAIARYSGRTFDADGDKLAARFDGPGRALRCAIAVVEATKAMGIELSAGVHVGEITLRNGGALGATVKIAGSIAALARPGEVLASRVVADLLPGSGIIFTERAAGPIDGVAQGLSVFAVFEGRERSQRSNAACAVDSLSVREKEVLALVASGLTNAAIGERLALSPYTVKRHVGNILLKLDLPNRAAAANLAAQHPG